jgi:hypothetical protein
MSKYDVVAALQTTGKPMTCDELKNWIKTRYPLAVQYLQLTLQRMLADGSLKREVVDSKEKYRLGECNIIILDYCHKCNADTRKLTVVEGKVICEACYVELKDLIERWYVKPLKVVAK